ncbi:hypothetical protein GY45DRAFT_122390 [Cubamyces sp. BRFM 1775]|nr:hypothetical protein GY45DRAFT_122390 [Cubamyces sp. BRFM 1775]
MCCMGASLRIILEKALRRVSRTRSAPLTEQGTTRTSGMELVVRPTQSPAQTSVHTGTEPHNQTSTDKLTEPPPQTCQSTDTRAEPPVTVKASTDAPTEHPLHNITGSLTEPVQASGSADSDIPRWVWALRQLDIGSTGTPALDDTVLDQYPSHHELCRLYRACLQYLRGRYAVVSLVCSVQEDLQKSSLWDLPVCFGTLANFVADTMPLIPSGQEHPISFGQWMATKVKPNVPPLPHALAFLVISIASNWKYFVEQNIDHCHASHILCTLLASTPAGYRPTELDLYHGLLLDCLTHYLKDLWRVRTSDTASPMPFSRESLQELQLPEGARELGDSIITEHDLPYDAIDTSVPTSEAWTIGLPFDIPWLGARHDERDYPVCSSLSGYTALRRPKGVVYSLHDDAALWLSAMTFGLLEAITQMRIPARILLAPRKNKEETGETVVSGPRILQVLALWVNRKKQNHGDGPLHHHDEHGRKVTQLLRRTLRALTHEHNRTWSVLSYANIPEDKRADIRCGIAHLVVILWNLMRNDALTGWASLPGISESIETFSLTLPDQRVLYFLRKWYRQMLLAAGWCPYTISAVQLASYDLAALVPHLVRLPPHVRTKPGEHADCQEDVCVLHTITDTDSYRIRHAGPSCECNNVRPPLEDVLQMLDDGVVPVVVYDGSVLRVIPAQDSPYVAISHVWSEGMGSTTDVGLPRCLVDHISTLVRGLLPEHDGAFWMDSLCVPSSREQRKRAIKLMADTYRNATKVLVIDDSVRTLCHLERTPGPEVLLRIATSAWVRRVWTLQEGLLAHQLCFEFIDGAASINKASSARIAGFEDLVPVLALRAMANQGPPDFSWRQPSLFEVVFLLRGRMTTKAEDELIAIASLLQPRVQIDELLAESDGPNLAERRMKVALLGTRDIPLAVPFGTCPRSTVEGFSWAPCMLSKDIPANWSDDTNTGTCTEEGLVGRYTLALLGKPITIPADRKNVDPTTSIGAQYAKIGAIVVSHRQSNSFHVLTVNDDLLGRQLGPFNALLFLPKDSAEFTSTTRAAVCVAVRRLPRAAGRVSIMGALVHGTLHEHPIAVQYVARLEISRIQPSLEKKWESERLPAEELGDLREVWIRLT